LSALADRRPVAGHRSFGTLLAHVAPATWAIAVLAGLPLAALIVLAVRGDAELWPHLIAFVLPQAARDTAMLLAGVAAMVAVIGLAAAWLTSHFEFPGRGLLAVALTLPLAMPGYIVAYTYVDLLAFQGPVDRALRPLLGPDAGVAPWLPDVRSMAGAIFVLGITVFPYVYLTARAMFATQSACAIDAARTLGARPGALFFRVALPLARPAVAAGVALALLETLNDIGASEYLGVRTLTVAVFSTWLNKSSLGGAAQIALTMLAVVFVLMWIEWHGRRHQRFTLSVRRQRIMSRQRLSGRNAGLATLVCALPVLFGFVLPAAMLLVEALPRLSRDLLRPDLWRALGWTLTLAGGATILVTAAGFAIALEHRWSQGGPLTRIARRVAGIGYAIPGTILALGLIAPLAAIDNWAVLTLRDWTGWRISQPLIGTGVAVLIACLIRFASIGIQSAESSFARVPGRLDDAARNLGAGRRETMRRILFPIIRGGLATGALLTFVDVMKELPATLLLRPLGAETLATSLYAHATRGSYEDGAVAALLIVVAGLLPVIWLARRADQPLT
jgi:iron(III) transport system permease protein